MWQMTSFLKNWGRNIIGLPPRLKWFPKSLPSPTEKVTFLVVFWISLLQKKGHKGYFGRTWPCFLQKSRPKTIETTLCYTPPEAASLDVAKCALVLQMRFVPGCSWNQPLNHWLAPQGLYVRGLTYFVKVSSGFILDAFCATWMVVPFKVKWWQRTKTSKFSWVTSGKKDICWEHLGICRFLKTIFPSTSLPVCQLVAQIRIRTVFKIDSVKKSCQQRQNTLSIHG